MPDSDTARSAALLPGAAAAALAPSLPAGALDEAQAAPASDAAARARGKASSTLNSLQVPTHLALACSADGAICAAQWHP